LDEDSPDRILARRPKFCQPVLNRWKIIHGNRQSSTLTAIEKKSSYVPTEWFHAVFIAILFCLAAASASGQTSADDWQQRVRTEVQAQHLDAALTMVEQRLAEAPDDLEAHGWRGRLLAWKGRWPEGEAEYRLVLRSVPNDVDVLTYLSDVLLWQQKWQDSLQVLDQARKISPSDPEVLLRRARVLSLLRRGPEARAEYQETLTFDPENHDAKSALADLGPNTAHELRVGDDVDLFNYTGPAGTQSISLSSRWNQPWSTVFGISIYQRFGENAAKFMGSTAFHFTHNDWLNIGGAVANEQQVVPTHEAFLEYGHALRFRNHWVQGLESSYQQHWFWYDGAHVLTFTTNQIVYLPRNWTWTLVVTGARTGFTGTPVAWEPSGWSKIGFPLPRHLTGNVFYAVGTENYSQIDQIGRIAGHTYGAGLRYQLTERQDLTGYVSRQYRDLNQTVTSFGLSYGIHF
jgi:tetratricopeptide (TPR) repeat protein